MTDRQKDIKDIKEALLTLVKKSLSSTFDKSLKETGDVPAYIKVTIETPEGAQRFDLSKKPKLKIDNFLPPLSL